MKLGNKRTLLLVEDEFLIALEKQQELEKYGYKVIHANTSEKAVALSREHKEIDLILMDIDLGRGIDGIETAELILKEYDIPVVFMSSHVEPETVEKTEKITSFGYVVKNSSITVFDTSIKMAFKLFDANYNIKKHRQQLETTLNSIGDAVISTDTMGMVIRMNPMAEKLTGWDNAAAAGLPLTEVFNIINAGTHESIDNPVSRVLETGLSMGLDNNTLLIACDKKEYQITGSAAPIIDPDGTIIGVVLVFTDVTEQCKVEEQLKTNELLFRSIFNESPLGIAVIDSLTGQIYEVNPMFAKIAGRTLEEMENIDWISITHPDDIQEDLDQMAILNSGAIPGFQMEKRYIRKDGTVVWVNMTIAPVFVKDITQPRHLCMIEDITTRRQAEAEILALSKFPSENPNPVLRISKEGLILYFNEASIPLLEAWGCNNGKSISDKWVQIVQDVLGRRLKQEIEVKCNERTLSIYFIPVPKLNYVNIYGLDITERKRVEQEIKQLLSEKEVILKEVHHRIKNNFTSIESLLSLQADANDNEEAKKALNIAIGRVRGMSMLYERLLLTDDYRTVTVKEYLNNLIGEIVGLLSGNLKLTIKKQIDDIQLDSKQLFSIGLIVNELLTNIIKYAFTDRDSGFIEIRLKESGGEITLTIQDNGNGFPEDFDIVKQKGFGLVLIKILSDQLGGSFTIDNHNGTRSVVKFCI